jgi:hypothetical protein
MPDCATCRVCDAADQLKLSAFPCNGTEHGWHALPDEVQEGWCASAQRTDIERKMCEELGHGTGMDVLGRGDGGAMPDGAICNAANPLGRSVFPCNGTEPGWHERPDAATRHGTDTEECPMCKGSGLIPAWER